MLKKKGKVAVIMGEEGDIVVKEYPLPDIKDNELLIKIDLCGVCGTDVHTYYGGLEEAPFPTILGHEICGIIVEKGKDVKADFIGKQVKEGDRIILVPAIHCHKCYYCAIAKTPSKCMNMISYGFMPEPDKEPHFTGGYAEYLHLYHPDTEFFKIDAPAERAVFTEPLAIAVHAVDRSHLMPGQTAVVQGAGAIGLLTMICAKSFGASKVAVVGRRRKERLELAKELGADLTINMEEIPEEKERVEMIREFSTTGYGADVVFECAGNPLAFKEGIHYLRDSATLCEVGHFADAGSIDINPCLEILTKNITIEGIYDNEADHFSRAIPILEKPQTEVEKIISHRLPLTKLMDAFRALREGIEIDGRQVIKSVIEPSLE